MSNALTPQQVLPSASINPTSTTLNIDEIQGDILVGLQKKLERFIFFTIVDADAFKATLRRDVVSDITTTRTVIEREHDLAQRKADGNMKLLSLVGLNVGFTQNGINTLLGAETSLGDSSFEVGAAARASDKSGVSAPGGPPTGPINDPVDNDGKLTTWLAPFLGRIDGVFLITGGFEDAIEQEVSRLAAVFGDSWKIVHEEAGNVRPGDQKGHEHFGWQDGISQPAIKKLATPFPGQAVLEPGLFVFGYPQEEGAPKPALAQTWMENGSFMVFRRLRQLVPEFSNFILTASAKINWDPVIIGARLVGRWKSGAPIALTPAQDDLALAANPNQNNNFDFSDDTQEHRCPFSAHIRKSNPRSDLAALPSAALNGRRIIRQGIPYGPEVGPSEAEANKSTEDRGLLFVCYQTSILGQFEFVQGSWINNPQFVSPLIPKPTAGDPVTVGIDPIMGQPTPPSTYRNPQGVLTSYPAGPVLATSPGNALPMTQLFITPTGGGYFFMPSIAALKTTLAKP